jgi:PleD family two-component response regulator
VSIGVGTCVPGQATDWMAFLDSVDRRLYRAKDSGRDRIESDA